MNPVLAKGPGLLVSGALVWQLFADALCLLYQVKGQSPEAKPCNRKGCNGLRLPVLLPSVRPFGYLATAEFATPTAANFTSRPEG